jgi:phosphatidate cytidylyltransferase
MKNLIIRALTGVIFVALLVGCIVWHPYTFAALFAVISALTTWEFGTIVNRNADLQVNRFITSVSSAYLFIAVLSYNVNLMDATVFIPYLISIMYLMISELYFDRKNNIQNWAFALMSQIYIALPFALLNTMSFVNMPDSCFLPQLVYYYWYPLALFIFLWSSDTGAYCFGSLLGRHRLFPRVSPKKSWEGSIGGTLVALLASQIIATYIPFCDGLQEHYSRYVWGGFALTVVIFGTWGDLVESLLKRRLGIKDSGNMIPGHGGMLDRFDSSLMAIPAVVIYIYTVIQYIVRY